MNYNEIHTVKDENVNVIYHYKTFTILSVNTTVYHVMDALKKGYSVFEISNELDIPENNIISIIKSVEDKINKNKFFDKTEKNDKIDKIVDRITLHVANDCNLRCKYCYASGGSYKQERTLMNSHTANNFFCFCLENFSKVNQVVFFGGEPMLNVEIMKYVCNLFKKNYSEGKISYIPKFGIITNGTIINSDIVDFLKENISNITVSIDGPKDVNDANRVYSNGKGSFDAIKNFIQTIKNETPISIMYEATYTRDHIEMQYNKKNISSFMQREFGIKGITVEEESLDVNRILDYWKCFDYTNVIDNNFENMPSGFWGTLKTITSKEARQVCPIMKNIFAISTNGNIFPCHMLTENVNENFGNIKGRNLFVQKEHYKSRDYILNLLDNPKCNNCWSRHLCGGCAVFQFYDKQEKQFQKEPNIEICNITKLHLEKIILMIATLRKNPLYWKKLISKAKEKMI